MSDAPKKGTILRCRFAKGVKLGGSELDFWAHDRNGTFACEATSAGLVFASTAPAAPPPVKTKEGEEAKAPPPAVDVVVPWPNVISYERVR